MVLVLLDKTCFICPEYLLTHLSFSPILFQKSHDSKGYSSCRREEVDLQLREAFFEIVGCENQREEVVMCRKRREEEVVAVEEDQILQEVGEVEEEGEEVEEILLDQREEVVEVEVEEEEVVTLLRP